MGLRKEISIDGTYQIEHHNALIHLPPPMQVIRHSSLYETVPAYVVEQPKFLNAALLAKTVLKPLELLAVLKDLEARAGRQSGGVRFGPRPLDIDIIFYGKHSLRHDRLEIPHPRCKRQCTDGLPLVLLTTWQIMLPSALPTNGVLCSPY